MVVQTYSSKSQPPKRKKHTPSQKPSDFIRDLLITAIPKVKRPEAQLNTIDKCINVLLTQMLFDGSDVKASALLKSLIRILLSVLELINTQKSPSEALTHVIVKFKEASSRDLLTISEPTLAAYVDTIPIKTADHALDTQLKGIQSNLKKQGIFSKEIALCIDPTDKIYRGKFHNRWTNWGVTGQVATFKRAYKECGIYSNPSGLFVSSAPMPINPPNQSDRTAPAWLEQVKRTISKNQAMGMTTKLLIGDREFATGIGMAYAYFGMFSPDFSSAQGPRLLCPLKNYDKESEGKWAFLLNHDAPQVEEKLMQMSFYHAQFLGNRCSALAFNDKRDHLLLPLARVAAFDSYSRAKERRSLKWAHIKAHVIDSNLAQSVMERSESEKKYFSFRTERGDTTITPMKYSKKGRKIFKDRSEKPFYDACRAANLRVIHWQNQKDKLMRRLIFFGVSLHQGEAIITIEHELVDLVEHYHERWGIEICFKGMKWEFNIPTNVRTTKARHVRKIISGMVYNSWHVSRLKRWSRNEKKLCSRWKPYNDQSPPIKKKYNQNLGWIGTAHSYLLESWADQVIYSIKNAIQGII